MNEEPNKPRKQQKSKMDKKLNSPERAQIEELLESAMREYVFKQATFIKSREDLVNRLSGYISEYLGPFMLIGYDVKGQPVNIIQASSQLEADAISTAINKFIFNNNSFE